MEQLPNSNEIELLKQSLKQCHVMYAQQHVVLLNALKAQFGDAVMDIVERANGEHVCQTYLKMIPASNQRTIEDFIALLWEPLRQRGYEFTIARTQQGIQMTCTACPFAKLYQQIGAAEWGYRLYCAADDYLVAGFNPKIGFKRTMTLMQGHAYCDHVYYMKP